MNGNFNWDGESPSDLRSALLDGLPNALQSELSSAADDIGVRLVSSAREHAPVDRGTLRSDLDYEVSVDGRQMEVTFGSNLDHAEPMETGTSPFMPPPSALEGWAARVLGDEGAAYPVALSIAETGLDGSQYFEQALESEIGWASDRIDTAVINAFNEVGFS